MRKLFLPVVLLCLVCSACNRISDFTGYDSGWVGENEDIKFKDKLTKSDIKYLAFLSLGVIRDENFLIDYITGDELSSKYGVSHSIRQENDEIKRLKIKNGIKILQMAKFYRSSGKWKVYQVPIPKD